MSGEALESVDSVLVLSPHSSAGSLPVIDGLPSSSVMSGTLWTLGVQSISWLDFEPESRSGCESSSIKTRPTPAYAQEIAVSSMRSTRAGLCP